VLRAGGEDMVSVCWPCPISRKPVVRHINWLRISVPLARRADWVTFPARTVCVCPPSIWNKPRGASSAYGPSIVP
jgi:hypothetical protein